MGNGLLWVDLLGACKGKGGVGNGSLWVDLLGACKGKGGVGHGLRAVLWVNLLLV